MNIVPIKERESTEKVVEERIIPVKKEFKLLASVRKIPSLTMFGWNIKTGEVKELEIEKKVAIGLDGNKQKKSFCQINPNEIIPIQALNIQNAVRKVENLIKKIKKANDK